MESGNEFMECDTCRAKPGSPALCAGCLHNRQAMSDLGRRIVELEAQLKVERFLNVPKSYYDKWERVLRHYASGSGDKSPTLAREALGVCEYWDSGDKGKRFMRLRRLWRRIKERFSGACC